MQENAHTAPVNVRNLVNYNKRTKYHHKGKSRNTLPPDKISQAAASTNNKQTVCINLETDTRTMLISFAQLSPTGVA